MQCAVLPVQVLAKWLENADSAACEQALLLGFGQGIALDGVVLTRKLN